MASDDEDSLGRPTRFTGTVDELEAAMMPLAELHCAFCTYSDESKSVKDAKVVHGVRGVEGHSELLQALYSIQPNLSFSKGLMEGALELMLKKSAKKWRMTIPEQADWMTTMTRRIRNLCRVVSQAQLKQPPQTWLKHVPLIVTPPSAKKAVKSPAKYKYTFDNELQLPVRTRLSDNFAEPGLPMTADSNLDSDGFLMAEWPDGEMAAMPGMTPESLRGMIKAKAGSCGELFGMDHKDSNNRVSLRQKVDRTLLMVAYEQTKILVCVRMNLFAKIEDERCQTDPEHPACKAAVEFMKPLVVKYCSGKVERAKLNELKHQMLQDQGVKSIQKSVPMKRPASAMKKPSAAVKAPDADDDAEDEEDLEEKQEEEEDEATEAEEEEATVNEVPEPQVARTSKPPNPKAATKQAAKKVAKETKPPKRAANKVPEVDKETNPHAKQAAKKGPKVAKKAKKPKVAMKAKANANEPKVAKQATSLKAVRELLAAKRPAATTTNGPSKKSWSLSEPLPSVTSQMERFLTWP
jgi:hypothetical protein